MLIDAGYAVDDEYVNALMKDFDTDGSGNIEVTEIEQIMQFLNVSGDPAATKAEAAKEAEAAVASVPMDVKEKHLKQYDANGDGVLDAGEVKEMMQKAGYAVDDAYVQALMSDFDTDGSGAIEARPS